MSKRLKAQPRHPLKRWTENAALRATNARYRKIDLLLQEIAMLWGDEDQGNVDRAEDLRGAVEQAQLDVVLAAQMRAEERAERDAN